MREAVERYELELARRIGSPHAVAFACARHALTGILQACGLTAGDQVVLSPLTCKVVPLALLSLDIEPVYADISAGTLNLDASAVSAAVGARTRAVLFQHTYGYSAGIEEVAAASARADAVLVEDCAQCLPTASALPDTRGAAAIFSNNLLKPLPAGSGGVAVTSDRQIYDRLHEARTKLPLPGTSTALRQRAEAWIHTALLHPRSYWPLLALQRRFDDGYRPRPVDREIATAVTDTDRQISSWQARTGLAWLKRLNAVAAHRQRCCADYTAALTDIDGLVMPSVGATQPLYYFPVLTNNKFELLERARKRLIELVAWPTRTPIYPLDREQDLLRYGYELGSCPEAERVARCLVGLPTHPRVTSKARRRVTSLFAEEGKP